MASLKINFMDHIVLNCTDVERSLAFYTDVLGLKAERAEAWRDGKVGFPSIRINDGTLIDLMQAPANEGEATRHNMAHYCLVTEETDLAAIADDLKAKGVTVTQRPVTRWGARGNATSIYFLDPDGNEIEVSHY
jgi:catechol 2,3-dioxygenase-like lactoylglutathione lyase family enzyme